MNTRDAEILLSSAERNRPFIESCRYCGTTMHERRHYLYRGCAACNRGLNAPVNPYKQLEDEKEEAWKARCEALDEEARKSWAEYSAKCTAYVQEYLKRKNQ